MSGDGRSRVRRMVAPVAVVVTVAAVGWAAGSQVRSPAAAAADRRPPTPSLVTVPVERRTLSVDLVRRGSVRFDGVTALSLVGPVGGTAAKQTVTAPPKAGADVNDGDVLMQVNGRPVWVFTGDQPGFRSLTLGSAGADVRQLEEALARLGFDPGPVDGTYDTATQEGVRRLYEARGFSPNRPTPEEEQNLRNAKKAAADAADRLREAEQSANEAGAGPKPSALLTLQNDVRDALEGIRSAMVQSDRGVSEADATIKARQADADAARAAVATAEAELAEAKASGVDPVDPMRSCGTACLGRLSSEVDAKRAAVGLADDQLRLAVTARAAAASDGAAAVAKARQQLAVAQAQLAEGSKPADRRAVESAVAAARSAAADASAEVARLESTTGISVPAGEVLFVPALPRRVDSVKANMGDEVGADFASLSGSQLAIDSSVDAADAGELRVGSTVTVRLPEIDRELSGTLEAVAEKPGTNGAAAGQVYVRIRPDEAADAAQLNGIGVVVTIPLRSTGDEKVLTVPIAALSTRADRSSWLTVSMGDRRTKRVRVAAGLQGDGVVEVTPTTPGTLEPGDRVVVEPKR